MAKNNSIFLRCKKNKAKGKKAPMINEFSTVLRILESVESVGLAPVFLNL
jgi:hypothetical protein